jgi:2-polyprenyl-3-methyl-5-hydroxy-6-metoxy-1,4-benzoquinol methylase
MENELQKKHWDKIYAVKKSNELSWSQTKPVTSLDFIHSFKLSRQAAIIDVGGGESNLVDELLREGFEDITVLDISALALERVKTRLGTNAVKIKWIVSDITKFEPQRSYDVWHDRATFHFLTTKNEIENYLVCVAKAIRPDGYLTVATFSEQGPVKCSGLPVKQYSEQSLDQQLNKTFVKIRCINENHQTPLGTLQNFLFCSFRRGW